MEVEALAVDRNLDARTVVDGGGDVGEDVAQEVLVEVRRVCQREVKVFGEAVGLEEALFEAGSALKDSAVGNRLVVGNTPEQPAEHVVLFDDVRIEPRGGGLVQDLALVNHGASARTSEKGSVAATGEREPGRVASGRFWRSRW